MLEKEQVMEIIRKGACSKAETPKIQAVELQKRCVHRRAWAQRRHQTLRIIILEGTQKQDGSFYPAETVYSLLCGLYRHLVSQSGEGNVPNFMAKKNPLFADLNAATDKHYRMLRQEEVGTS